MPSFAELLAQAEAEGVLTGRSETLPAGNYNMYVESVKLKSTKKGDPSISVRWKTDQGQIAYQNLNFIPDNKVGNAITISNLVDFGVTKDFLARVDVSQGLGPIVPELIRVTTGRWFRVEVTVKKNDQYTNNQFFIKTDTSAAAVAAVPAAAYVPQVAPVPVAIPAPAPVAQPVYAPQPAPPVYAPQAPPPQQMIPQPAPAPVMQPVPPAQAPAYVPQPIPQPAAIPQSAPVDPATGLPPRPGV